MSENISTERAALNWRGPLLAAAIFAGVFGTLLLMAHLSQSNSSDEGSSFRQDPYGTSLLFDSYERTGYEVKRSADEKTLADLDAARTTAFFIGGYDYRDFETRDGKVIEGGKFHDLLEDFLARGGRVILLQHDPSVTIASISETDDQKKPSAPKWHREKSWGLELAYGALKDQESKPFWIAPQSATFPPGGETIYLAAAAPTLKTDAEWTTLYATPASPATGSQTTAKVGGPSAAQVYMAARHVGKGELVAASQQSFLLNEAIKTHPNPVLLDFLADGRTTIWVDETLHGLQQNQGVLWLVHRYRLQAALLLFWATLLVLLWSAGGDLVRRPARDPSVEVVRHGEDAGVSAQRLLRRSVPAEQVAIECWDQFRRRSPQDAQAISQGRNWGPRLRVALSQSPLPGYQELKRLISERRASRKALAPADQESASNSIALPRTTPEEGRIA